MKKLLLFASAILFATLGYSQSPTFNEGDVVLNAGIGFGTSLYSGSLYSSTLPPISISAEFGVKDDFITDDLTLGIGGYIGIAGSKYGQDYGYKLNYTVVGVRGVLHYPLVDKLDTYAGLMLGYRHVSHKEFGTNPDMTYNLAYGGLSTSIFVGARYYFTDNIGGMLELGWGVAYINLGLAVKF